MCRNSGSIEILSVAADHGPSVHPGCRGNKRIDHRDWLLERLTAPCARIAQRDGHNALRKPSFDSPEPALKCCGLLLISPVADARDPLLDLAKAQYGDIEPIRGRRRYPLGHAWSRPTSTCLR